MFLLSVSPADARDFLLHAWDLNMMDGTNSFITIGTMLSARFGNNTWQAGDGRDADAVQAFEGECVFVIIIRLYEWGKKKAYSLYSTSMYLDCT